MSENRTSGGLWEKLVNVFSEREAIRLKGRSRFYEDLFQPGNRIAAAPLDLGAEILDLCSDHPARFKIPSHIRFVEDFPQTATGKIQKFRLQEQAIAQLPGHREDDNA